MIGSGPAAMYETMAMPFTYTPTESTLLVPDSVRTRALPARPRREFRFQRPARAPGPRSTYVGRAARTRSPMATGQPDCLRSIQPVLHYGGASYWTVNGVFQSR